MAKMIVTLNDKLHRAFRIKCLQEQRSMKDKITEYIKNDLGGTLEMDEETFKAFLEGKQEINEGEFITLQEAKKRYKVR